MVDILYSNLGKVSSTWLYLPTSEIPGALSKNFDKILKFQMQRPFVESTSLIY